MAETKNDKGAKADKGAEARQGRQAAPPRRQAGAAAARARRAPRASRRARKGARRSPPAGAVKAAPKDYVARLKKLYRDEIVPKLTKEFGYKNALEVPRLDKIVLNMGVGEAVNDTKKVDSAAADLALIAGQKPVVTRARKAIATFKVRENMPIGCQGDAAQDADVRVSRSSGRRSRCRACAISAASTRSRSTGAATMRSGVKEHIIFPEIDYDKAEADAGAWTSWSARRRRPTPKRRPC